MYKTLIVRRIGFFQSFDVLVLFEYQRKWRLIFEKHKIVLNSVELYVHLWNTLSDRFAEITA